MAITITLYDHTINRFNEGENLEGDTYKLMLLDTAVFDATHTTLAEVIADSDGEVFDNGWPEGGFTLTSVSIAVAGTNGGKFDAADVSQAISGGSLGSYSHAVIYKDTAVYDPPVAFIALESAITVTTGNNAAIEWHADGIIKWAVVV